MAPNEKLSSAQIHVERRQRCDSGARFRDVAFRSQRRRATPSRPRSRSGSATSTLPNAIATKRRSARRSRSCSPPGPVRRDDLFVTTKLWNNNHRPERVKPALQASLDRLGLDAVDLYLVHTPFAFQPGDDQDPRDAARSRRLRRRGHAGGNVGRDGIPCRRGTFAGDRAVRHRRRGRPKDRRNRPHQAGGRGGRVAPVSPAMGTPRIVQGRTGSSCWPSPHWDTRWNRDCSTTRSSSRSLGASERRPRKCYWPGASSAARRCSRRSVTPARIGENFDVTALPESAIQEINERLETRYRFNSVVDAGEPGFSEVPAGRG